MDLSQVSDATGERLVPLMVSHEPGTMPGWKLAPLTTPPASMVGVEIGTVSAGARSGRQVGAVDGRQRAGGGVWAYAATAAAANSINLRKSLFTGCLYH